LNYSNGNLAAEKVILEATAKIELLGQFFVLSNIAQFSGFRKTKGHGDKKDKQTSAAVGKFNTGLVRQNSSPGNKC